MQVKRISPEEAEFAFIEAIYDSIKSGADESTLKGWHFHLTSTSYEYCKKESEEDIAWSAHRWREQLDQKYRTLHHTVYQKMMGVVFMIKRLKKVRASVTTPSIVKLYDEKVGTAEGADKISGDFIDTALTFFERVLSIPSVADLMQLADNDVKNPFDGSTKIQAIISKASSRENIAWTFHAIWDLHKGGFLQGEGVPLRSLQGRVPGSGGKGLVDLLVFKLQLLRHLLDHLIDPFKWSTAVKATLRTVLSSHTSYREHVGYPSDKEKPPQQWRLGFPDSAEEFFNFVEMTVYGVEHDMVLKGHLKNRKSVQDFDEVDKLSGGERCA